jgi:hypothetical protein
LRFTISIRFRLHPSSFILVFTEGAYDEETRSDKNLSIISKDMLVAARIRVHAVMRFDVDNACPFDYIALSFKIIIQSPEQNLSCHSLIFCPEKSSISRSSRK